MLCLLRLILEPFMPEWVLKFCMKNGEKVKNFCNGYRLRAQMPITI